MSKYIDVDKLQETVCKRVNNPAIRGWLNSLINEQPTADVAEVRHGRNIEDTPSLFEYSLCGWSDYDLYTSDTGTYNYCPNCGARMDVRM